VSIITNNMSESRAWCRNQYRIDLKPLPFHIHDFIQIQQN